MSKSIIFNILLVLIMMTLVNCKGRKIDAVYYNAKVYTVDNSFQMAESFAVDNGKFVDIGPYGELLEKYTPKSLVNLEGKFVYPGFIDAHAHFIGYAISLQSADLVGTKSFGEVLSVLMDHSLKHKSEWILGRGWDQNDWEIKEFPDKEKLDELFPENPVMLTRVDGHAVLVNSAAMKMAGITSETKVEGGEILLMDGEPSGILLDNAIDLVSRLIPKPEKEKVEELLQLAQEKCFAVGLTSISDAGLDLETIENIDSLQKAGKLKMRLYVMLSLNDESIDFIKEGKQIKTDYLNVRSLKLFADGALGSRGACLIEPYADDNNNHGFLTLSVDSMERLCQIAYQNNYQVNVHAIGDSANRVSLQVFSSVLKEKNDRRWRIEHAQIVHPNDFDMFGKFSIIPSVQPTHATSDMYWADERLGEQRVKYAYAYKQLLDQNGWIPHGSDFPVESINPVYGFYAAVSRKDLTGYPPGGFQMENALTREEALKAMTIWAAKSSFEENEKGSIEPGKWADFVVLDKDIMEIAIEEVPSVKVLKTFIEGKKVY